MTANSTGWTTWTGSSGAAPARPQDALEVEVHMGRRAPRRTHSSARRRPASVQELHGHARPLPPCPGNTKTGPGLGSIDAFDHVRCWGAVGQSPQSVEQPLGASPMITARWESAARVVASE